MLKKKLDEKGEGHTDLAEVEVGIVVEPMQRLKPDISRVRFVEALQDNRQVSRYGVLRIQQTW